MASEQRHALVLHGYTYALDAGGRMRRMSEVLSGTDAPMRSRTNQAQAARIRRKQAVPTDGRGTMGGTILRRDSMGRLMPSMVGTIASKCPMSERRRPVSNDETERLLVEIGRLLARDTEYPLDGTLLHAEIGQNFVGPSIFKNLAD